MNGILMLPIYLIGGGPLLKILAESFKKRSMSFDWSGNKVDWSGKRETAVGVKPCELL
jgi:hypothetical protein